MTKKAVINASPLIQLAKLGRLKLLNDFFGSVFIPRAVIGEINDLDITELAYEPFDVTNRNAINTLLHPLHIGEAEVIIGAVEHSADFAVLDDLAARNKARLLGLDVIGTLGILQRAKKQGMIYDLERDIIYLRNSGMYISDSLIKKILSP
ncbi:MAG: DUF3368 domain-containing protein [Defluviitaleaceae bacterium]|nr:DUF3368 domain-containing protein [Defluviitaleaceae bacterium]